MVLPVTVNERHFRVTGPDFAIQEVQGRSVLSGPKGKTPIPPTFFTPTIWVLSNKTFSRADYLKQPFAQDVDKADKALNQLLKMGVIAEAEG